MDHISNSLSETANLAKKFLKDFLPALSSDRQAARHVPSARLVGLVGDLGSGKTAFVKSVAKILGIKRNITSPTFVIEKIYSVGDRQLVHIDAYRLSSTNDLKAIGFDELAKNPDNVIFVEWPERVFHQYPTGMKIINFNYVDENKRKISW